MTLKPKLYGLVGFPIKHSLSPCMYNAAFTALKIKAKYKLFELAPAQLENFLRNLKKKNICGFNVTYPYKEEIIRFLNSKSSAVKEIGAANTVVVDKSGKLKGFNTDYLGFKAHLKELKLKPKQVALIGAGGAAKAVCFALAKLKVSRLYIYDIDKFKSLSLFKKLNSAFPETKFNVATRLEDLTIVDKDLLINASPVGMRTSDPCLVAPGDLHPGLFVYDLIYSPQQTKLISLAKECNLNFSNGLGMLLYQGVFAFEHFSGKTAPVDIMKEALLKGVMRT
ncbi:MAG: shikimate dehydrogenase [Candidatus Omnitrophica bacterium CG11_big_fil_rev_8_21_14_0_20_43_6]|nr:MAG: shikimate dehydrogenase [Candidatus Omnitrophica bacterium CG11_big_fil_rev_8_21_14_0_20_43_6]